MNVQPQWTPHRIEVLTTQWLNGTSATLIAKKLGVSRSAVIGKAHRLQLKRRDSLVIVGANGPILRSFTPRAMRERGELPPGRPKKPKIECLPVKAPQPVAPAVVITLDHARPWQDRASQQCAYLLDDGRSCCMATPGRADSYCAGHKALMYRRTEKPAVEKMARKFG